MMKNLVHNLNPKISISAGDPLPTAVRDRPSGDTTAGRWKMLNHHYVAMLVTVGVLCWSYLPNLIDLGHTWSNDPNYTHGFLVIPIALIIFWTRPNIPETSARSSAWQKWAWGSLALLSVLRVWMYEKGNQWVETLTLVPTIGCLVWTYGGLSLLKRSWPAIVFLVFLLPLPRSINGLVSLRLQDLATRGSSFVMQLSGLWVVPQGNIININTNNGIEKLEVANVCNGLSMLMSLAAVVIATITLIPMPLWKRIAMLASVVPIALFSNIIRIVSTGWCYYLFGGEHSRKLAHDWAGFLMMPLALGLVFIEMMILSWLADEGGTTEDDPRLLMPLLTVRKT